MGASALRISPQTRFWDSTRFPHWAMRPITALLSRHCCHNPDKMLAAARRAATIEQRKALAKVKSA